jgi:hypothetical protein
VLVGCASGPTAAESDAFREAVEETFKTYSGAKMKGNKELNIIIPGGYYEKEIFYSYHFFYVSFCGNEFME